LARATSARITPSIASIMSPSPTALRPLEHPRTLRLAALRRLRCIVTWFCHVPFAIDPSRGHVAKD
jgi:hypothetical protein